jgi:hypothetical protein
VTATAVSTPLARPVTRTSRSFPLFGAVAGLGGTIGSAILWLWIDGDVKDQGLDAVVDALTAARVQMHIGTSISWIAMIALIGFAVGFLKFLSDRVPEGLVQTARLGLTAGVGTMIFTNSLKSLVVGGIPGGIDEAMYMPQDLATLHLLADQAQWVGWMGVVVAMAVTAVAAFRHGALPKWFGLFSAGLTALVAGMTLILGLPYSAGLAGPLWLIVGSVVMFRATRREI